MKVLGVLLVFFVLVMSFSLGWSLNKPVEEPVSNEKDSPADHILESDIHVYEENIVIDVQGASGYNALTDDYIIEISPMSADDINKGDLITVDGNVHRVAETGNDGQWYALANSSKLRFKDIDGIVVGIVY